MDEPIWVAGELFQVTISALTIRLERLGVLAAGYVRFSITIRQRQSLRNLIEAIPEEDWTPIPYWMDGAADVAETTYM